MENIDIVRRKVEDEIVGGVWQQNGENIVYNKGNVGIGTTSPGEALEIKGNVRLKGLSNHTIKIYSSNGANWASISNPGTTLAPLQFTTGGGNGMYIDNTGNVGIGTSSPSNVLEVSSAIQFKGITISGNTDPIFNITSSSGYSYGMVTRSDNKLGIGKISDLVSGSPALIIDTNGNVGIGTTSPATLLHINGLNTSGIQLDGNILVTTKTTTGSFMAMRINGSQFYIPLYE